MFSDKILLASSTVFPWILNDYESETLDLNDPSIYRDLSKPVGALNPDRLKMLIDRYNDLDGFPKGREILVWKSLFLAWSCLALQ